MTTAPDIRILIIDDHPLIRAAAKMVLNSCKRFDVIGEAADGPTGIKKALKYHPDVVLTDINMEPLDGIHTTRTLLANAPSLTVIGFSALPNKYQEQEMLDAGAVGVIHKSASRQEICQSIIKLFERRSAFKERDGE